MISRRQTDIGKESQRPHEHFDVARFSMALLDQTQFAVQDRMWAKKCLPLQTRLISQVVTSGGQIDTGRVCPRPCEYFAVIGPSTALLDEPQSAVPDRIWASLKVDG